MPTIAELQINVDTTQAEKGTKSLLDFATAAEKAAKAGKGFNDTNTSGGGAGIAPPTETNNVKNLSEAIDAQTRKLNALGEQRKKLNSSDMKSTMPAEYDRLNRIIDANISKVVQQGNAVDQVNTKRGIAFIKAEKQADAELKAQERLTEATIRQENVLSTAAARQQRELDSTINGLSRQIKAQNEYNATVEKLNLARATGGMDGGSKGHISGAEYDSYIKLAQAQRDASLATEDNSRVMTQTQNKLDTYTATLGKVERAEVQYARAVKTLNEAQQLGLVTTDQYDQKLSMFTAHRDKAVAAANDNTIAEQRFARELQSVLTAYDPVLRAQEQYNNSVKILSGGLEAGAIDINQYNKALEQQAAALDKVKHAGSGIPDLGKEYDAALNSLVPYRAELRNLEQQEKVLKTQKESGKVATAEQVAEYDRATAAIERHRNEINKRVKAGGDAALSYKQEQAALRGMPAQITDIVVSLQGGQAPLTVLLQQGGQIKDMFGGIIPAFKAMGTALAAMITPTTLAISSLAILGAAAYSGSKEVTEFNRAVIQSANASGVSSSQFSMMREELDRTTTTSTKAAEALTQIAGGGRIASDMFTKVAESAILFERATGQAMDKTIEDFNAIGKDPVEAAVRLDEKYHFLTASVLAQADALVKMGQEQEAVKLLQGELSEAATTTANRMIEEAGWIEQAWHGVKTAVTETWDAMKNVGRDGGTNQVALKTQQDLMERTVTRLKEGSLLSGGMSDADIANNPAVKSIQAQIDKYQQLVDVENVVAAAQGEAERNQRKSVSSTNELLRSEEAALKGVEKAENDLKKVRLRNQEISLGTVSPELADKMAAAEARAVKDVEEARKKANRTKETPLDTTSVQEVKSNLAVVEAEYAGYYKRVTALGDANIVSAEATYQSQKAILDAEGKAVASAYDQQIDEIKKLQGNKKNSAAQNISLENQLSKAEAARTVAMEKNSAKQDALTSKEKGRIEERTRNIASYKAALDSQLESLQDEGARNADGVGRGDRQADVAKRLAEVDRSFDKQQAKLATAQGMGMDPVEYAEKLKDLEDTHTKMTEQIIANDRDIQRANYKWTNGYTAAVENAQDAGVNFAGNVESALTGAFNAAGDALGEFVTTGKMNFKDFASSVAADMAKIAARQATMGALGAIFNIAGAAFSGGATAGTGAAASDYTGSAFQAWSVKQAQGGGWEGGTQFFAKGGAFTNSVVSKPTSFGMSGGNKGVMGEAGPEAIVPLTRTSSGDLGVRMVGAGGAGNTLVNVNVQVDGSGSTASSDGGSNWNQFGNELGTFVNQRVYTIINSETRPGGTLQPQGGR